MAEPKISILLPSRGRTEALERSVQSLIDCADSPENLQWLLGFDQDDHESQKHFIDVVAPKITKSGGLF